jgi:diacylglycerol O-acyltransferase / trehalose O-mycolyltransferase
MRTTGLKSLIVLLCLALAVGCTSGTLDPARGLPDVPTEAGAPARVLATTEVSDRVRDLVVDSPAVGRPVGARLLVPTGFAAQPDRRWPVLYLLHGCCDDYRAWTRSTDVEQLSATSEMIIVMPDGGAAGFYSNWRRGQPNWETFHLFELGDLLRSEYRADDRRAVAGLSMGGLGALSYAARHPGMFAAAASFSGIVHTRLDDGEPQRYLDLVGAQGEDPLALWGDPVADDDIWAAHNPYDLIPYLAGTKLYISTGDGRPGPFDPPGLPLDELEASLSRENEVFTEQLAEWGLDAEVHQYGPGTHTWPYWQRELHRAWPLLEQSLRGT